MACRQLEHPLAELGQARLLAESEDRGSWQRLNVDVPSAARCALHVRRQVVNARLKRLFVRE